MPIITVNINRLKWNFAWIIISTKAFLVQNLRLIALLVLEIWRHKIPSEQGNEPSHLAIYPQKTGLTFKKWVFMSRIVLLDPKLTLHVNFSNFQAEENFSFSKCLGHLNEKRAAATPLIDQFSKSVNVVEISIGLNKRWRKSPVLKGLSWVWVIRQYFHK